MMLSLILGLTPLPQDEMFMTSLRYAILTNRDDFASL